MMNTSGGGSGILLCFMYLSEILSSSFTRQLCRAFSHDMIYGKLVNVIA